jgi:hypothetical protein
MNAHIRRQPELTHRPSLRDSIFVVEIVQIDQKGRRMTSPIKWGRDAPTPGPMTQGDKAP